MSADAEESVPGADSAAPRIIAERYEVRDLIGRGAFGEVLEVYDRRLSRLVALKTMPIGPLTDAEAAEDLRRFYQEAQSVARLSHPGIVTVHDFGEAKEFAWIAMELVIGETLKAVLDRKERPPLAETVRVVCALLEALQYAHGRGIVHRDVKPANILLVLSAEEGLGEVRLADFGIARIGDTNQTVTGQMMGTPATMSPEQLRGEVVDLRADLWSVGVILYELLTGARPFPGGMPAIFHNILTLQPKPPSELMPGLPPGFDTVIATALAKSPADRYPDAGAMAAAIQAAAFGMAPALPPLPGLEDAAFGAPGDATVRLPQPAVATLPAAPRSGTRRGLAIGFLLGVLCGGLGVYLWMTRAAAALELSWLTPQDKADAPMRLAADLVAREAPPAPEPAPPAAQLPLAPPPAAARAAPLPDAPLTPPGLIIIQPPLPALTTIAPTERPASPPAPDLAVTEAAPAPPAAPPPDAPLTPPGLIIIRPPLPVLTTIAPSQPAPMPPAPDLAGAPDPGQAAAAAMQAAPEPPPPTPAAVAAAPEPEPALAPAEPTPPTPALPVAAVPSPEPTSAPAEPAPPAAAPSIAAAPQPEPAPDPAEPAPPAAAPSIAAAPSLEPTPAPSVAAAPQREPPPAAAERAPEPLAPPVAAVPVPAPAAPPATLRPAPSIAAARAPQPPAPAVASGSRCTPAQVTARSGSHGDYGRIVFQWRVAADYALEQDGATLQLRFSGPGCLPAAERLPLPRNVRSVQPDADGGALRIELAPGARVQHYRLSGGRIVIDVYDGGG